MRLSLVPITSTDGLALPGLLYEPSHVTKKAAIWLHGMGDSGVFYNPHFINPLGQALTDKNTTFLAFNNRGAHNAKTLYIGGKTLPEEDRVTYQAGTNYEKIADCVQDIDGAVDYLKQRGYSTFYLLGHSTGANKICAYHVRAKHNPFSKYVLAGPGDDSGLFYNELGANKFHKALSYAKQTIKSGGPLATMPKYTGMSPFSAQAAEDIMDPDGNYNTFPFYEVTTKRLGAKPLFKEYASIDREMLIILGANDEYTYTAGGAAKALDIFRRYTNPAIVTKTAFQLVASADHGFSGHEQAFAKQVANWLERE
jgi:pimeloyl-ACP methyl ester carboxylesterase